MDEIRTVNVEEELKGVTVLRADSGDRMGDVLDAIVDLVSTTSKCRTLMPGF